MLVLANTIVLYIDRHTRIAAASIAHKNCVIHWQTNTSIAVASSAKPFASRWMDTPSYPCLRLVLVIKYADGHIDTTRSCNSNNCHTLRKYIILQSLHICLGMCTMVPTWLSCRVPWWDPFASTKPGEVGERGEHPLSKVVKRWSYYIPQQFCMT